MIPEDRIIVGFSTTSGLPSALIRYATESKYSHTYLRICMRGQWFVLDSSSKGVRLTPWLRFKKANTVLDEFEAIDYSEQTERALSETLGYLNNPYDWKGLFGQGIVIALSLTGIKTKNPFRDKYSFICTELVWNFANESSHTDVGVLDRETIRPQELYEVLSVSTHYRRLT